MSCRKLQLPDYFQLVENDPIKYCGARFIKYFYAPDGSITAREVSGIKQNYIYDVQNQLTAVIDSQGNIIEQYTYDPVGNILKKSVRADSISAPEVTTYKYDAANQLTSRLTLSLYECRSPNANSHDPTGNNALRLTANAYGSGSLILLS